ncbi:MAG: DUF1501 domain-containing protein [Actinobacteria bacterium]|nr:DUF1501 domain-containing protein [Actinomycetota bacterium]
MANPLAPKPPMFPAQAKAVIQIFCPGGLSHLDTFDVDGVAVDLAKDLSGSLGECDIAVLLQTHSAYDLDHVAATAPLVFDTRGKMTGPNVDRL